MGMNNDLWHERVSEDGGILADPLTGGVVEQGDGSGLHPRASPRLSG